MREMKNSGIAWMGEIPREWNISRIKYVADVDPSCDKTKIDGDSLITYTPMECIRRGNFVNKAAYLNSVSSSLTAYEEGDIVMAKVTPCFENGNIAIMTGLHNGFGIGSSELLVFRPKSIVTEYLFYWLQNYVFVQNAKATMTGTGGLKRVSPVFIKNCSIHMPPKEEQNKLVAFLDSKCTLVDTLIQNVQTQIEKLKAYKQSLITEVVTRGLDPTVPMKDSGVEWIGEIPEHWNIISLGGVTSEMRNGYVGPTRDLFVDNGVRYIQSLHTKDGLIDFYKHPYYVREEWANQHPKVHTGDVLIVQTGDIGQVALVNDEFDCCNCHALIIATPNQTIINPGYLTYYLLSFTGKELMLSFKTGALLPHLNSGKIKSSPICVPDMEAQIQIVDYLRDKLNTIETLIAIKQAKIEKLEQYKKSLIYEYVTGKKEVV